jgi:hypothetical protein
MTYYIKRTSVDYNWSVYLAAEPGEMRWIKLRATGTIDHYQSGSLFKCEQYPKEMLAMLKENCSKNYKEEEKYSFEAVEVTTSYAIYVCGNGCCNKPGFATFSTASDFGGFAGAAIYLKPEEDVAKCGWRDSMLFETRVEAEELTPLLERLFPGAEINIKEVTININETNSTS